MVPSIFPDKDFSSILNDNNEYGYMFMEKIRERGWYGLVYTNVVVDVLYCPDLVKKFYENIDPSTIKLDLNHFIVHFDSVTC